MKKIQKILSIMLIGASFVFSSLIYSNAGIIPYINLGKGQISFLLSIENRGGKSGLCVTDFGGGGKKDKDTAAKEGFEETMGIFTTKGSEGLLYYDKKKKKNVLNTIAKKKGIKFFKDRMSSKKSFGERTYITYFVDVTDKVKKLGGRLDTLKAMENRLKRLKVDRKFKNISKSYKEKRGFVWVTKDDLLDVLKNNNDIDCFVLKNFRWSKGSAIADKNKKKLKLYHRIRKNLNPSLLDKL